MKELSKIIICYLIVSISLQIYLFYEYIKYGEGWAEIVTNYHINPSEDFDLISYILKSDYGYISPILRIFPIIAYNLGLSRLVEIRIFGIISSIVIICVPLIVLRSRYINIFNNNYLMALLVAILINTNFNFESRLYLNIGFILIIPIYLFIINMYKNNTNFNKYEYIYMNMFVLSKPILFPLVASYILINTKKKLVKENFMFFMLLTLWMVVQALYFGSSHVGLFSSQLEHDSIKILHKVIEIIVHSFYSMGKLLTINIIPIYFKIYEFNLYAYVFGAIVGFLYYPLMFMINNKLNRRIIIFQLLINIIWSTLLVVGTKSVDSLNNQLSTDFNRYDALSGINIIIILALLGGRYAKTVVLYLISLIIINVAAVTNQFNHIRNNLLYMGTSIWAQNTSATCSLISPLGWGDKCVVHTNISNRNFIPKAELMNGRYKYDISAGGEINLIYFVDASNINNQIHNSIDKSNSLTKEYFLINYRRAIVNKYDCGSAKVCTIEISFKNTYVYKNINNEPIFAWFNLPNN